MIRNNCFLVFCRRRRMMMKFHLQRRRYVNPILSAACLLLFFLHAGWRGETAEVRAKYLNFLKNIFAERIIMFGLTVLTKNISRFSQRQRKKARERERERWKDREALPLDYITTRFFDCD